jgi:hypothetical protein
MLTLTFKDVKESAKQLDVAPGQTVMFAGYRILVEKISLGKGKGSVRLRVWTPEPAAASKPG